MSHRFCGSLGTSTWPERPKKGVSGEEEQLAMAIKDMPYKWASV